MVNEIETNVCKKKKRKRERFFACRCSHLRKRDHILDNCERALGKYRFDYPFDRSFYPLFSFFFFSPMRTLKFSAWSLSDVRAILYAFIVFIHTAERDAFFDSFPRYTFSSLFSLRLVFSHCSSHCNYVISSRYTNILFGAKGEYE